MEDAWPQCAVWSGAPGRRRHGASPGHPAVDSAANGHAGGGPKDRGARQPTAVSVAPTTVTTPVTPTSEADALKARIDRLEQQNRELMEMLKGIQKAPATTSPTSTLSNNALSATDVRQIITATSPSRKARRRPMKGQE